MSILELTGAESCKECGERARAERDRLQAENAKLRKQLESIVGRSFRTADKMACLEDENDKLRELVQDMAAEIRGLGIDFARVGWCDYADRMRELGVEP